MYTTREEMREKKKWAPPEAGWFPGWNFAERRALPPKAAGRERKGGRNGEKYVYSICLLFHLFLCIFTNTKMDGSFMHIFMYTQKRKNVYVKLHTANKAGVMRAYVYVCILRKRSGWFRCADFRKFCAGLFAYFFCGQQEKYVYLYVQKRKQNVYVYIHKKKNKMHMFTYAKFEAICIA